MITLQNDATVNIFI